MKRLNNKTYDESIFKEAGFEHTELFFPDGTCPPDGIIDRFLGFVEGADVVALHCKAGLGRTGTLAGCHMIKNWGFTAAEAIGWIRVCRPGSVIGPQQQFFVNYWRKMQTRVGRPISDRPAAKKSSRPYTERKPRIALPATPKRVAAPVRVAAMRNAVSRRNEEENRGLEIRAVPIVPQVPQPRKLRRVQGGHKTPRN